MNDHQSPSMTITLDELDDRPEVLVSAVDLHRVTVTSLNHVVIDKAPVSFVVRAWYVDHYEQWVCSRGANVKLRDTYSDQPATGSQREKLFAAITVALRTVPASFLLQGQTAHLGRTVEQAQQRLDNAHNVLNDCLAELRVCTTAYEAAVLDRSAE